MDLWRYFDIVHRDHSIMNPVASDRLDEMIGLLDLPDGARVLDIGCGKAEPLVRVAERYAVHGIGVDPSPGMIAEAEKRASIRVKPPSSLEFRLEYGASFRAPEESFDLAICLGASWAFGGHKGTLQALSEFTRPGGLILVGEPHWLQKPRREYLEAEDVKEGDFSSYEGNLAAGVEKSLVPLYVILSTKRDFDRYEWLQTQAGERFARENPQDPDVPEFLLGLRAKRDRWVRFGRDTIGWGMYLFRK